MNFDEWMLTVAPAHKPTDDSVTLRLLRRCWEAAQAAERERCAKLCEWLPIGTGLQGKTFAEAIRGEGMGGKMAEGFGA